MTPSPLSLLLLVSAVILAVFLARSDSREGEPKGDSEEMRLCVSSVLGSRITES